MSLRQSNSSVLHRIAILLIVILIINSFPAQFAANAQSEDLTTSAMTFTEIAVTHPQGWYPARSVGESVGLVNNPAIKLDDRNFLNTALSGSQLILTFGSALKSQFPTVERVVVEAARSLRNYRVGKATTVTINGVSLGIVELTTLSSREVSAAVVAVDTVYGAHYLAYIRAGSAALYQQQKDVVLRIAASMRMATNAELSSMTSPVSPSPDASLLTVAVTGATWTMQVPSDFLPPDQTNLQAGLDVISSLAGAHMYIAPSSYPADNLVLFMMPDTVPGYGTRTILTTALNQMSGGLGYTLNSMRKVTLNGKYATVADGVFFSAAFVGVSVRLDNGDVATMVVWLTGSLPVKNFTSYERKIIHSIAASLEGTRSFGISAETVGTDDPATTGSAAANPPVDAPAGTLVKYADTLDVQIPAGGETKLVFAGTAGDIVFVEAKVGANAASFSIGRADGVFLDGGSSPYPPYHRSGVRLPVSGYYTILFKNFQSKAITVPTSITTLVPDNQVTVDGRLTMGEPSSSFIDGKEEESWIIDVQNGQTIQIEFDGIGRLEIKTTDGRFVGTLDGWQAAASPMRVKINSSATIRLVLYSLRPQNYRLRVSLEGQASGSLASLPTPTPGAALATPAQNLQPTSAPPTTAPAVSCPGLLPSRLIIGGQGRVSDEDPTPLNLRAGAGRSFRVVSKIPVNGVFEVLDGPVCAGGYAWWKVSYRGLVGWAVESIGNVYAVEPVN